VPGIAKVTYVVRAYDEARDWFVRALGFEVVEDTDLGGGKRWVVVRPAGGAGGCALVLGLAADDAQGRRVGDQTGGRVAFFLEVPSFAEASARMRAAGVRFLEDPRHEPYGTVAVFEDLYGNRWDLLEPA
jgi:catechol 2,3-dioxygenase-like lactoylglutathione lyase family enzyme